MFVRQCIEALSKAINNILDERLKQLKWLPQAAIFWEAEDIEVITETGGGERSDGATWPGANITPRHGNAVNVAIIDGSVQAVSMDRFQAQQVRKPGMLWCVPNRYGH